MNINSTGSTVGSIAGLWRFPVKSMQGERLQEVELTAHGVLGDRAYALIDSHGPGELRMHEGEASGEHSQ